MYKGDDIDDLLNEMDDIMGPPKKQVNITPTQQQTKEHQPSKG